MNQFNWNSALRHLRYKDDPIVLKGFLSNPSQYVTWKDVENVINTDSCYVELIRNQVKIDIPGFPTIYKSFSSIDYALYNVSRNELMNDFVLQGRLKELVIEWLRNREEWSGIFDQPFRNSEQVVERFVNDEAVFHFFKRTT